MAAAESLKIEEICPDEIRIQLTGKFTVKVVTPPFDIEINHPAKIILQKVSPNEFTILIKSPAANIETKVSSFELDVFDMCQVRVIRIVSGKLNQVHLGLKEIKQTSSKELKLTRHKFQTVKKL